MLAITNLAAIGIGLGCLVLGIYLAYIFVAWALSERDEPTVPYYDENSYS